MKADMDNSATKVESRIWHAWGPLIACALLTSAGIYGLLLFASAPLANYVLLTLALGCPLAIGLVWWLQGRKP